ncbi:MAG: transposase [Clostridia bacterium]|nr:transposase [Clostridia bacterium]
MQKKFYVKLEERFPIELMGYVIMPNHIHFLMYLQSDDERATAKVAPTVGQIIGAYKSLVVHQWRGICNDNRVKMGVVWQRNYYEHIIRNEMDFTETIKYIDENPLRWLTGEE